jgi:hypothetical protein
LEAAFGPFSFYLKKIKNAKSWVNLQPPNSKQYPVEMKIMEMKL